MQRDTAKPLRVRAPVILKPRPRRKRDRPSRPPKAPTSAMLAWEALTPAARAARTHSAGRWAPYLSNPSADRLDGYEVPCGHCGHRTVRRIAYRVKVNGSIAFLCYDCLNRGRDANHRSGRGDAMRLAVERQHRRY